MFILSLAVLAAMAGAIKGNRAAWPLLLGVAVGVVLRLVETPFSPFGWWIMDVLIILAIVALWWLNIAQGKPPVKWRELAIIAIFGPQWVLYVWQPPWQQPVVELLVSAQLAITFPIVRFRAWMKETWAKVRSDGPGSLMVAWS